jgi:hypothetical protein
MGVSISNAVPVRFNILTAACLAKDTVEHVPRIPTTKEEKICRFLWSNISQ